MIEGSHDRVDVLVEAVRIRHFLLKLISIPYGLGAR